jgi:hypothetical protein
MDMNVSDEERLPVEILLAASENMLARAALQFEQAIRRLERAETVEPKAATVAMDGYTAAFHRAMTERDKVDKLRNQISGTVGGRTLDLDAARVEIGRRLACLRDA